MKTLKETLFIRTLAEMAAELLKEVVDQDNPRPGQFTRGFTNQEEYLRTILSYSDEVSIACDQLHYALSYLSGYQSRKTLNGELITRADYIAYQLENLYLRFIMIPDRSLRLTNEVFRLGIPARECKNRTVTDNQHLRGTEVRKCLRIIEKSVQPYREMRNTIAHLSRYNDPKLRKFEVYSILQKSEGPPNDPVLELTRYHYKHKADQYIDAKRNEFGPVVDSLVNQVGNFFEKLLSPFQINYKALK